MGWLSNLIAVGGAIAAPFTGGTSLLATLGRGALAGASDIGETLGGAAAGAADERLQQLHHQLGRGRLVLDRTGLEQAEQQRSARNEVLAQLFGNVQDMRLRGRPSRVPDVSITGGIRPSALGNRQAIQELLRQRVEVPDIDKYIHAGGLETALGVGGALASGVGAFAPKPDPLGLSRGPDPRRSPRPPADPVSADPKSVLGDLAAPIVYGPPAPKPRLRGISVDPFTGQPL